MENYNWNPWHGCHKVSPGCQHCYVYRGDARYQRDSTVVRRTESFNLPLRKKRDGSWRIPAGSMVWTCFTSDFLVADADDWRDASWEMMRRRSDLNFLFITKRVERLPASLPADWGSGYANVCICCTVENQQMADQRLPIFREIPAHWKGIACEPLLEALDLRPYLGAWVRALIAGGESGPQARICDFDWVLSLRQQCMAAGVPFRFKQTGALLRKDGRIYHIERRLQHAQARKANIDFQPAENTDRKDGGDGRNA